MTQNTETTNRASALACLRDITHELFEIDPDLIHEDTRLEDLDIDSIDAIDLIARINELTGRRIQPEEFKGVKTIGDAVNLVITAGNSMRE